MGVRCVCMVKVCLVTSRPCTFFFLFRLGFFLSFRGVSSKGTMARSGWLVASPSTLAFLFLPYYILFVRLPSIFVLFRFLTSALTNFRCIFVSPLSNPTSHTALSLVFFCFFPLEVFANSHPSVPLYFSFPHHS